MKIVKCKNFSEWYNEIIKTAELCDLRYNIKGFIVIMPWAMRTIDKIYELYEKELEYTAHYPAFFPSLIPEKMLKTESEHVTGFIPEVFWVTEAGEKKLEERYALKPTGETSIYPIYALWINGISDLPLKIYQRNWVWRYDTKATKPFIRGREFLWIEAHDVFASENEAKKQVIEDTIMAKNIIWEKLGIPFIFFKRPQWDKFPGAEDTFAADTFLPDLKVLQIVSTHLLAQRFSKVFNIRYLNEENKKIYAWQTTYGPGINRIYASLIAVHGDEKGLVLPFEVAPIQIVIVPIIKKEQEDEIKNAIKSLADRLKKIARVEVDLRACTPGFKFNYWEQKGVPLRIEFGVRELADQTLVLVRRDNGKKKIVHINEIENEIEKESAEILVSLKKNSAEFFAKNLDSANTREEMSKKITDGKLVKVAFCTDEQEGKECGVILKEKYACDVRGSVFSFYDSNQYEFECHPPQNEKCIQCGKPANVYVYVARQY